MFFDILSIYVLLSGPVIIQTQNITNMCQAYRNLCLNGRCIPMPGIGYRCECNMGFKLDGRGECIGRFWQGFFTLTCNYMKTVFQPFVFFFCFCFFLQMMMNVRETRVRTENVWTLLGLTSVSVLLDSRPLLLGQSAEVSFTHTHRYIQYIYTRTHTLRGCLCLLRCALVSVRSGWVCGQRSYLQQRPLCEHWRQLSLCLQCWIWDFSRWQKLSRFVLLIPALTSALRHT